MVDGNPSRIVWRKSSFTTPNSCVEVAPTPGAMLVRDSKDADGPVVAVSAPGWAAFLSSVHSGKHDEPPL